MLCFSKIFFEIGPDVPLSEKNKKIGHLQQGIPENLSEA